MSRYLRPRRPGASVFFTVAPADRRAATLVDWVDRLRSAVRATMAERPFHIDAWVVLPDHLHAIWNFPEGDTDHATHWRLIKSRVSRGLPVGPLWDSHVARQERGIWQRRFWERHIRDDRDFAAHLQCCRFNPVKHGLVERPEDWPWSSVHRGSRLGRYGW